MLLRVSHLAKAFGATHAVRDCSFELRAGEVRALVGENGCGKSTVVKILSGVHVPDAGTVEISGEPMAPLRAPRQAQRLGIVTVFQEVLVAESCSVLDNVWLGSDDTWRQRVPSREKRTRARRDAHRAPGATARPRGRRRGAVAVRSSGLRNRAGAAPRPQNPDPRRGHVCARRRHQRPLIRDRPQTRAEGHRRHLHHPPAGRDRRDRGSNHGDAVRRDRRRIWSAGAGRRSSWSA